HLTRPAYRAAGSQNLYPADPPLNRPPVRHSHAIRRLPALEAPRTRFQDAQAASGRQPGQQTATRQLRARTPPAAQRAHAPDAHPPPAARRAKAKHGWLKASVTDDARTVIAEMFNEADRRDPEHQRAWVCLVDGNNHQIDRIRKEARKRNVKIPIVVDFIHVL